MNSMLLPLTHISAAATGALVAAVWQGMLLALLVLLLLRLLPGLSAAARSIVWLNVFALMALLHFVPLAGSFTSRILPGHAFRVDIRWSLVVAALWLTFSLWRAVQLFIGALHVSRVARCASPVAIDAVQDLLQLPRGKHVRLCTSAEVARPSVLGFLRPRILMPPTLIEELSVNELRQVIVHEMEHLRRHDDWTNLLQKIALILFPLNPALLWVERRLCAERELACDDRVLHSGSGRKAYALCLTHLAQHSMLRSGYALVLGAWERRPELVRRVQRILSQPTRGMNRNVSYAVTGSLVAGAFGCALTLAHAPQLVRFAPALQQARTLAPINPKDLGLEGTPQFVRATLPTRVLNHTTRQPARTQDRRSTSNAQRPVRALQVVARPARRRRAPASQLAQLRTPPPPTGTLLVMTEEWNDNTQSPFVIALASIDPASDPRLKSTTQQQRQHKPQFAVRATYAVVTPAGWLILQI